MPRRYTVETLPQEQKLFILDLIVNQKTDRYICHEFEQKFGKSLPKSSLARWRTVAGEELADRALLVKLQANEMLERLKESPDADKFALVMKGVDDRLLTAMSEVNKTAPAKLIILKQEELRRALKERELALKEQALHLEREKVHGVALDRAKLGEEYAADLLEYIGSEPEGLRLFSKHVKPFQEFIKQKYAATQS